MNKRTTVMISLACVALAASLAAQTIREFPTPVDSSPFAIAAGPDGSLWYTDIGKIGRITTEGAITEFPLSTRGLPQGIAAGPDGALWFTEEGDGRIGRITTEGMVTEFALPDDGGYQAAPIGIAAGPDGALWFTDGNEWFTDGNGKVEQIGRITTAGTVSHYPIAGTYANARAIAAGNDGNLWFTGRVAGVIGRITPGGVVTEFATPIPAGDDRAIAPNGIAAGADGNLWFTDLDMRSIGRITPDGVVSQYPMAGSFYGFEQPDNIAAGPDGNLWFAESGARSIGRVTPAGAITHYALPSSGGSPQGIAAGPDGNLWFTEFRDSDDGHYRGAIGRISTSGTCTADTNTLCIQNGRFAVRADWTNLSKETSGHGSPVQLTPDSGYFWFFDASNVEVVVKVLDACHGPDGHYWVFAAGLTNVDVVLTVTDSQTDQSRTYRNPARTPFQPVQDTSGFATCP